MCPQDYRGILIGVTFVMKGEIEPYISDIDYIAFPQLNTVNAVVVNKDASLISREITDQGGRKTRSPRSFVRPVSHR